MTKGKRYWKNTTTPTDDQVRRKANKEYWDFRCPKCDEACTGEDIRSKEESLRDYDIMVRNDIRPRLHIVTRVSCWKCNWEWIEPRLGTFHVQSTLEEFLEVAI